MIILFAILALAAGLLIPAIVFDKKDKKAEGGIYKLSRLGFVGWFFGSYFLTMPFLIICYQIERPGANFYQEHVELGFAIWGASLLFISNRRIADIEWSKWLLLLGVPFLFLVFGRMISFWWYVVLMCVPGKGAKNQRVSSKPAPSTPESGLAITLMQNNQSYGPYQMKDLLDMWDKGQIAGNALYRHEGRTAYKPLAADIEKLRKQVR